MPDDTIPQPEVEEEGTGHVSRPIISDESWAHASSAWLNSHVRNSPISQSVEAWNHLGLVLHKLRDHLELELTRKGN
jgi:hypothetical protein